ncbi:MAG: DNA repair protein RecO [Methanococcaceae archaeon]
MSEIVKTEAIVLSKMNYGESSKIAVFYTYDSGKLTGIIKGARSAKSSFGLKIDPLNQLQLVLYKKHNREMQLITQAELVNSYHRIKEDFDSIKYATAVLELINVLTIEEEINHRIFKGLVRILSLFEQAAEPPPILLIRFILFLLTEIGYHIQFDNCAQCHKPINETDKFSFSFEHGILCNDCSEGFSNSFIISKELFILIKGLSNKNNTIIVGSHGADNAINFLEKFIKYHVPDFKGIKSIHLF